MKKRSVILIGLLITAVPILCIFLLFSLMFSGCGGNEEAAQRMRALSDQRLESLFRFAQTFQKTTEARGELRKLHIETIPTELKDLNPKSVRFFFGSKLGIHVSGCYDDKVYLFVEGLDPEQGRPQVLLSPGENQGTEVLWQE